MTATYYSQRKFQQPIFFLVLQLGVMSEGKIVFGGIATQSGLKVYSSDVTSVNSVIQALVPSIDFQIDQKRSFGAAPQTKGCLGLLDCTHVDSYIF